jgi:hypothetical protein
MLWQSKKKLGAKNVPPSEQATDITLVAGDDIATTVQFRFFIGVTFAFAVGGNGHWYLGISNSENLQWDAARIVAKEIGGHLVTITTLEENEWVLSNIASDINLWMNEDQGPWIGAFNNDNTWMWIDGSEWSFENWHPGNPDPGECCPAVVSLWDYYGEKRWQDHPVREGQYTTKSYIVGWSN